MTKRKSAGKKSASVLLPFILKLNFIAIAFSVQFLSQHTIHMENPSGW
jgi:hypothetical protein